MTNDTYDLVNKFWNYIKDNSEFKSIPAFEMIGALNIMRAKLEYDLFKRIENDSSQSMDEFLRTLK